MTSAPIRSAGAQLKDGAGRTLILRGVNLGGSSKVPRTPNGATYLREGFCAHRAVSFVGRPFPLEEADEHFARLRAWGLTFLRLLVTWEALEHAGPGQYDEAYLDYLEGLVAKAGAHGFTLFIDPHQDVWSRFSGGDGAPGWTLEAVGFDITSFAATGAAIVHATHGDPFPRMIWPTNYWKLAAATMFTLFFGGDDFAPAMCVDGEPIQQFLQRHYCAAFAQVAARLRRFPHVVGYDTLNEPGTGFIGLRNLAAPAGLLEMGERPSPFQAMLLGAGFPQQVEIWAPGLRARRLGRRLVNPEGVRAWLPGHDCVWRQSGVWDVDVGGTPRLLRPQHFCYVRGRWADFNHDYLRPFVNRFARAIRAAHPAALIFLEGEAGQPPPRREPGDAAQVVYAPHWYDGLLLFTKRYFRHAGLDVYRRRLVVGDGNVRRSFADQVRRLQAEGRELQGAPTLIGEFGVPFDMQGKQAYRSGHFGRQVEALDRSMRALDDALASGTLWNYTSDNSNARGDHWNDEDLSVFSRDQQTHPADLNSGGRALRALVRPYARATAGEPLHMSFDLRTRRFSYRFRHDPAVAVPTEIFVPAYQYPHGCRVTLSDGTFELDTSTQVLRYRHSAERAIHEIRIEPAR